jgi:dihydroxy-acid dehydratase
MPEVANMKIPGKLVELGVTDMVRICDGRMSGTAYGTVILHVAPESAAGGPLSKIKSGDIIELDVPARTINVKLSDTELNSRPVSALTENAYARPDRGWQRLYIDHVMQADTGADLDFLVGTSGSDVTRESH